MIFVLVHSPLVGPGTWSPVALELERQGHRALVPSLAVPEDPPDRNGRQDVEAVSAALSAVAEPVVLVGHSGAGLLLPAIPDATTAPVSSLNFVDSDVPATSGTTPMVPPFLLEHLRSLAVDGMLPP
jgi:hypothetical protein